MRIDWNKFMWVYVIVIVSLISVKLATWGACINRVEPFDMIGCACPHPKFTLLHSIVPDSVCDPQQAPPQIYPGIVFK